MTTNLPLTPAQEYLARQQQRHPPRYGKLSGLDRAHQLYNILKPEIPLALRSMVEDGTVAIGEIGRDAPDARAIPIAPNGFVVEFTSGMMDFQYAVARALAGIHVEGSGSGSGTSTGYESVTSLLEGVLRQVAQHYKWSGFLRRSRITWPKFPISREVHDWIEMIVKMGEIFILAHELGHVALDRELVERGPGNEEVNADRCGLGFSVPATQRHWHKRLAYAGPIIPIQTFASLEREGVQFSDQYPPETERIKLLREQIRKLCPSDQYFYEVTTIMVSWQDMLDDIENHIHPKSPRALPNAERMLARLIAELEQFARGNVPLNTFIEDIGLLGQAVPETTMQEATSMLVGIYLGAPPIQESFIRLDLRIVMAQKLAELIDGLPKSLRPLFPA